MTKEETIEKLKEMYWRYHDISAAFTEMEMNEHRADTDREYAKGRCDSYDKVVMDIGRLIDNLGGWKEDEK